MDAHACHHSFQVLSKAGSLSKQCANNDILSKKIKSEWLHVGDTGKYWGASRLFGVSVSISRELSWINCVIAHTETTYCDTHTRRHVHAHIHSSDHSIPSGYKSPGRTWGRMLQYNILPVFLLFSVYIRLPSTYAHSGVCITSLFKLFCLLINPFLACVLLCPSALPIPSGYLFSQWQIYSEFDKQ